MKHSKQSWAKISYRFFVCLMILTLGSGLIGAAPLQTATAALVRIDLEDESRLAALAGTSLQEYTRLYSPEGGLALIAAATPEQQQALASGGFKLQVLEAEVHPDGYYGLYGLPEELAALSPDTPLLAAVERQAVARLSAEQREAAEAAGIKTMPLTPQTLIAPAAQPAAPAAAAAAELAPNPAIQQMVDALSQSTLYNYVAQLSGEQAAIVGGTPRTLVTRYTPNEQYINWATRFVFEHLAGLGLSVDYDYYNFPYGGVTYQRRNVIGEQRGLTDPSRIVLVTAHVDSYSGYATSMTDAPGADDNASGSAAVMAIADILSQYAFDYTIRYVFFTGEEQGLFGSWEYSLEARNAGDNIIGVLNLDMLGYENIGPPNIELHTRPGNAGDLAIANLFVYAASTYLPPDALTQLVPLQDGKSFSDHYPFWQRGYPAILAIEDWTDHTPSYHSVNDTLATLNMPYYTNFSKAALATFAHMAGLLPESVVKGTVIESNSGNQMPGVTISAQQGAATVKTAVTNSMGNYQMLLDPGTYSIRFSAANHRSETVSGVMLSTGRWLDLDADLMTCSTITGVTVSSDINDPILGEAVNFEAQVTGGEAPITIFWDFGDGETGTGAQILHAYTQPGAYVARATANNTCDYPVAAGVVILVEVEPMYLPVVRR